jgi:subtilisin
MRIILLLLTALIPLSGLLASLTAPVHASVLPGTAVPSRMPQLADDSEVIVVLDPGADPLAAAAEMGASVTHVYHRVFTGFAGTVPPEALSAARTLPTVQDIFADGKVRAETQVLATGVRRIDVPVTPDGEHLAIASPVDADIAILDTGVTPLSDLNVVGGKRCVNAKSKKDKKDKHRAKKRHKRGGKGKRHHQKGHNRRKNTSWEDNNGHGTHIAGITAAIDNDEDVAGVAPGARIWAVKVLDRNAEGTISDVICGLDWVVKHKKTIDVVNLSLSSAGSERTCQTSPLHRAVCQTVNAGIPVVVAAGNQASDASTRVPAAYDEVITVAAMSDTDGKPGGLGPESCSRNADDTFASFSNFGPAVDIAAPGDCILSLTPSGELEEFSGTSVAAPHVTGAVARFLAASVAEQGRRPTPAQTKDWLLTQATRPQDSSDGFTGDPDGTAEPMLWLPDSLPIPAQ